MITFYYGCMYAGKTTFMVSMYNNYEKNNLNPILLKPIIDDREGSQSGWGNTTSRNGLSAKAFYFNDLESALVSYSHKYIFIDEVQFLSDKDIEYLIWLDKNLEVEIFLFGLKTNNNGELFKSVNKIMALADNLIEMPTLCQHEGCTNKAVVHNRYINGKLDLSDKDIVIEKGNITYKPVCRKHWRNDNDL